MVLGVYTDNLDPDSKEKFYGLYKKYKNLLYKIVYEILLDEHWAEDIIQITYAKVFKILHRIEDIDSLRTKYYLIIIAKHYAYAEYNKRKRIVEVFPEEAEDYIYVDSNPDPLDILINKEKQAEVVKCVKTMKRAYRNTFTLKYTYHLETDEIAEQLNISKDLVRKRLQIIRDKLKKVVGE